MIIIFYCLESEKTEIMYYNKVIEFEINYILKVHI